MVVKWASTHPCTARGSASDGPGTFKSLCQCASIRPVGASTPYEVVFTFGHLAATRYTLTADSRSRDWTTSFTQVSKCWGRQDSTAMRLPHPHYPCSQVAPESTQRSAALWVRRSIQHTH